jgi:hypothetical protein
VHITVNDAGSGSGAIGGGVGGRCAEHVAIPFGSRKWVYAVAANTTLSIKRV